MYGFNNKVLRVNLECNDIKVEKLDEKIYRKYLGGRSPRVSVKVLKSMLYV